MSKDCISILGQVLQQALDLGFTVSYEGESERLSSCHQLRLSRAHNFRELESPVAPVSNYLKVKK